MEVFFFFSFPLISSYSFSYSFLFLIFFFSFALSYFFHSLSLSFVISHHAWAVYISFSATRCFSMSPLLGTSYKFLHILNNVYLSRMIFKPYSRIAILVRWTLVLKLHSRGPPTRYYGKDEQYFKIPKIQLRATYSQYLVLRTTFNVTVNDIVLIFRSHYRLSDVSPASLSFWPP